MKLHSSLSGSLCLFLLATALPGQSPGANWSSTSTSGNPTLRRENPGAASLSEFYVFGGTSGSSGGAAMNDLWSFDGTTWTQRNADGDPTAPPARRQAGVTWDFANNQLLVFGGLDGAGAELGDTWAWDPISGTWSDVTPASGSPSARRFIALTFDPAAGGVLLFGGLDAAGTHLNDTWRFDGTNWTQLSPAGALPPARRQHHLVTRLDYTDVLLFGGQDATQSGTSKWQLDTWRWDGGQWIQIPTSNRPNGQVANDAAYDLIRQRVVLTGGNGIGGSPTGTTAEFDSVSNDWVIRPVDSGIFKTSRYFAGYLANVGKTFKVSGQALNSTTPPTPTYEFQSDEIAAFTAVGSGCTTSVGTPELRAASASWLGRDLRLEVTNAPVGAPCFMIFGIAPGSTSLGSIGIGAADCIITVAPIFAVSAVPAGANNVAGLTVPLPADISLAGDVVLIQALLLDGFRASVSNRGDAKLGAL